MIKFLKDLTLPARVVLILIIMGVGYGASRISWGKAASAVPGVNKVMQVVQSSSQPVRVCVVTWGGYAGGQYFNGGFKPSKESRFTKKYGIDVEFKVIDDYDASRNAFKSGQVDLVWTTADSFGTEAGGLAEFKPKVVFQADWSRGGDAIVARREIKSVADLRGRKVSVAFGTPSHSFLLWLLHAGGLKYQEVGIVQVPSAIDSAKYFKSGQVDAAVVWSPDDEDCVTSVPGAHVLKSTRDASNIIADVFYAREEWVLAHSKELKTLVEGWLTGNAELNADPAARDKAAQILAAGYNQPVEFMKKAIDNTRLVTYGDNVNFFNLNGSFSGVKGEELYTKTGALYQEIGYVQDVPNWRSVVDTTALRSITSLTEPIHAVEGVTKFDQPPAVLASASAVATKRITVNFASGSAVLDDENKSVVDRELADVAKLFSKSPVRVEGNTDNVGNRNLNMSLSKRRAQAVADYLVTQYHFDPHRFFTLGNGPDNPIADNGTDEGRRKNRRTDFELLNLP